MQQFSRQWICKQVPDATNKHTKLVTVWKLGFLLGPCEVVIRKTTGATQLVLT
jgi:hypothetical protein